MDAVPLFGGGSGCNSQENPFRHYRPWTYTAIVRCKPCWATLEDKEIKPAGENRRACKSCLR
jgi:hypothetical protein